MASCRGVQKNLTAWIDGELSGWRRDRLQRHVATCVACGAEAKSLRRAIGAQRRGLTTLTATEGIDPAPLWLDLQRALRASTHREKPSWGWRPEWTLRPVAFAGGALAVAVILALVIAGGPAPLLISFGVEAPPVAVKANPELFRDYSLIQHLDMLENFDTVQTIPLDDDQNAQG